MCIYYYPNKHVSYYEIFSSPNSEHLKSLNVGSVFFFTNRHIVHFLPIPYST